MPTKNHSFIKNTVKTHDVKNIMGAIILIKKIAKYKKKYVYCICTNITVGLVGLANVVITIQTLVT